jgi:Na+/H+ antiporter NhaD/arsenite permease-like protein
LNALPVVVLGLVIALTAARRIGPLRLRIWQIMLGGTCLVLVTGRISPIAALRAINVDVMVFLAGMFVAGQALEESGVLSAFASRLFARARTADAVVLRILLVMGAASALLMNDTVAIVGTPVVLAAARARGLPARTALLALAFAVTIGSVPSPIGNPQNLLIALAGGVANPFVTFARDLALPTLVNLAIAAGLLRLLRPRGPGAQVPGPQGATLQAVIRDPALARLCRISIRLALAMVGIKIALAFLPLPFDLPLTAIAVAAAAPLLIASRRRWALLRDLDWSTLVFFASMFVLMRSVWDSGLFQVLLAPIAPRLAEVPVVLAVSVVASQLVSNVPLVAMLLPAMQAAGAPPQALTALAAGSTIAGNLFILGAASNVIIIQNAERRGQTLTFWEFARVGVPLTAANVAIHALFALWIQ